MSEKAINVFKPCELARLMGVGKQKIYDLIRHGDLQAEDWSAPGATRPRYRITPEAFDAFREKRRTTGPGAGQPQGNVQKKKAKRLHV